MLENGDGRVHKLAAASGEAHTLPAPPAQVKREYRTPEGMSSGEVDADSDGDVLVVLDLRVDRELASAGLAREIVNRWAQRCGAAEVQLRDRGPGTGFWGVRSPSV